MRFVVDLYRYIIIGLCAAVLITVALVVMATFDHSGPLGSQLTGTILIAAIGALALLILSLGGVAILISIHDRHVEIAESSERIAYSLELLANADAGDGEARA